MPKWTIEIEVEGETEEKVSALCDHLDENARDFTESAEAEVEYDGKIIFGITEAD